MSRRITVSLVLGGIGGAAWFAYYGVAVVGGAVAGLIAVGVWLALAGDRGRRRFFSVPPWPAWPGAVLIGVALAAFIRPSWVFSPAWAVRSVPAVAQGAGYVLHSDSPALGQAVNPLLDACARELSRRLQVRDPDACPIDIYWLDDRARYEQAVRLGTATPYGFFTRSWIWGPLLVARGDSGLGTLTHELAHHLLYCARPGSLPPWVNEGIAAFFEKFIAFELDGRWHFSVGYRSNWRFPELAARLDELDFDRALSEGRDQSFFRALMLFLHHRRQLAPFIAAVKRGRGDPRSLLVEASGLDARALESEWRAWMTGAALAIPMLESSVALRGEAARCAKANIEKHYRWDEGTEVYLGAGAGPSAPIPDLGRICPPRSAGAGPGKRGADCEGTGGPPSSRAELHSGNLILLQPDDVPGGNTGFENEFEYDGDARAAQRDFDEMFLRFKKEVLAAFPELDAKDVSKKGWSFEATFDKGDWGENIRCKLHSSGEAGTEAVSPFAVIRNRELKIDYHFFSAPRSAEKMKKIEQLVKERLIPAGASKRKCR